MRIATWNLNTWVNRKNEIDNFTSWHWADDNLAADLVTLTEAATPPPQAIVRAQDRNHEGLFLMNYIYLTPELADLVTAHSGRIDDFPDAFNVCDHAPLLIEMNVKPTAVSPEIPSTPVVYCLGL